MKRFRAIGIGIIIWLIGVSIYSLSFYIPMLENLELQANIFLSLAVLPLIWFGAKFYYRENELAKGYWLGGAFFLTAMVLDAFITVPFLIMPNGGSYYSFFTAVGFWLIGIEFIAMATMYWYAKVLPKKILSNLQE